jgi:hypothetical protein
MRRFAKSVTGETWFAGSNPVLSVPSKTLANGEGFFVELFQVAIPQAEKSSGFSRRGQTNLQKHRFFPKGPKITWCLSKVEIRKGKLGAPGRAWKARSGSASDSPLVLSSLSPSVCFPKN